MESLPVENCRFVFASTSGLRSLDVWRFPALSAERAARTPHSRPRGRLLESSDGVEATGTSTPFIWHHMADEGDSTGRYVDRVSVTADAWRPLVGSES